MKKQHKGAGSFTNICFDCQKACGGCSWSKNFTPVPGWTATPTTIKQSRGGLTPSYHITACPLFTPDERSLKHA